MKEKQRLREVLSELDTLPWNHVIYLPPGDPTLDTECLVLDPNDVESGDDLPPDAKNAGMVEGLGIDDVRDIRENARQQGRQPSMHELLDAFIYYLRHDAFIEFA